MNLSFLNAILKKKTPVCYQPVHRDDAVMEALDVAEREGELLAERVRAELLPYITSDDCAVSRALNLSLSVVEKGNGDTTKGSFLRAICVGISAGVGLIEMKRPRHPSEAEGCYNDQISVLHDSLSRGLAKRELGKNVVVSAPFPWISATQENVEETDGADSLATKDKAVSSKRVMHLSYATGTLRNDKNAVAQTVMQDFVWSQIIKNERPWGIAQIYNAKYLAHGLLFFLSLSPCPPLNRYMDNRLGIKEPDEWLVPEEILEPLAKHICVIDGFWPAFIAGKSVVWDDKYRKEVAS